MVCRPRRELWTTPPSDAEASAPLHDRPARRRRTTDSEEFESGSTAIRPESHSVTIARRCAGAPRPGVTLPARRRPSAPDSGVTVMSGQRDEESTALRTGPIAPSTSETAALVGGRPAARRRIGDSELRVFPIALGGNVFGWRADDAASERILDAYAGYGGNLVDTADSYAGGRSEIIIGNWLRTRRTRDDIVIATKVGKGADHPGHPA